MISHSAPHGRPLHASNASSGGVASGVMNWSKHASSGTQRIPFRIGACGGHVHAGGPHCFVHIGYGSSQVRSHTDGQ